MATTRDSTPVLTLQWVGDDDHYVPGVRAADLMEHQLARHVYEQTARANALGLRPGDKGYDDARAKLVTDLIRTGLYALPDAPPPQTEE